MYIQKGNGVLFNSYGMYEKYCLRDNVVSCIKTIHVPSTVRAPSFELHKPVVHFVRLYPCIMYCVCPCSLH